jgi:hypothetical protein
VAPSKVLAASNVVAANKAEGGFRAVKAGAADNSNPSSPQAPGPRRVARHSVS